MMKIAVEEHFTGAALQNYFLRTDEKRATRYAAGIESLDKRFEEMAKATIDMQVLSVGQVGLTEAPAAEATAMASEMNDEIASVCKKYPDKFAGFASLALQEPASATKELERAVSKLGLKGVLLNSHVNGEYLDEPKFHDFLETAARLDAVIYIHPNRPSPSMIKPYEKYPILTGAFFGFAHEVSLHAMRLILSGIFDEFPNLKVILGHMGEALPYWMWRFDRQWTIQQKPPIKRKPTDYIKENFWFSTSGMFWPTVIQFAYLALGADRLMLGVDYPIEESVPAVQAILNAPISDGDKEKIFNINAKKVLKL